MIRKTPLVKQLQQFFYNSMAELALAEETKVENLDQQQQALLIQQIIINTLSLSQRDKRCVKLANDLILNEENCPDIYRGFFYALRTINNNQQLLANERTEKIKTLAQSLMNTDAFQDMLPKLKRFILDAQGIISKELIRETFYNVMVEVTGDAISEGLIHSQHLSHQKKYIYLALSELTLLTAICQSRDCSGIRLLSGQVLTSDNCPREENFLPFLETLLQAKAKMQELYGKELAINQEELMTIKRLCLSNNKPIESDITYAVQCATIINMISLQISQSPKFLKLFPEVAIVISELYPPETIVDNDSTMRV